MLIRREHLIGFIKDRIQTFITATEEKYFPNRKFGKYYHVVNWYNIGVIIWKKWQIFYQIQLEI